MDIKLLHDILNPQMVASDTATLTRFSVDGLVPEAVVYPANLSQVSEVIKLANREKWAVTPWGSGTKISIGGAPKRLDMVLCAARLDKIIDIDVANLTVTAQAGVKLGDLQDLLGGAENRCFFPLEGDLKSQADYMCSARDYKGVFLPLDPPFPDKATLGGIMATNSTGPKRLRYGMPRDLILGVRYVSPTGEIIGMGGKTVKNVSGYDVSKIMIGSLGTLGIIGDITLRLLPLPEQIATILASFKELTAATAFAKRVLNSKLLPTSLEVLNRDGYSLSSSSDLRPSIGGWYVAVGLEGFSEEVKREIIDLKDMAHFEKAIDVVELGRDSTIVFWKNLANCALTLPKDGATMVKFKAGFLISNFPEVLEAWTNTLSNDFCALTASAGLGLACAYIMVKTNTDIESAVRLGKAFRETVKIYGGNMVVEFAPATLKQKLDQWGSPQADFVLMRRIKDSVDPLNVLNPGRFLGGI
ncbi:MAG: FAD-binding oxidoreductase [Deltaproteobacteria bacterium]|nr:FAD-binding oxidoreductase [Deltaproteobacteria bacterium]